MKALHYTKPMQKAMLIINQYSCNQRFQYLFLYAEIQSLALSLSVALAMRPNFFGAASHVSKVAHLFSLIVLILVLVWILHIRGGAHLHSDDTNLIFNVHPLVMTLGFILVIGEGIMVYKILPSEKNMQKAVHLFLQLTALTLGIFGVYAAFKYHRESQISDMYSLHSWLGIVTICLFGLQWLFGFVNFWLPGTPLSTRAMLKPIHKSAGLAIFLMTICTAETGLVQLDAELGTETRMINFIGLLILLFGMAVCITTAIPTTLSI